MELTEERVREIVREEMMEQSKRAKAFEINSLEASATATVYDEAIRRRESKYGELGSRPGNP